MVIYIKIILLLIAVYLVRPTALGQSMTMYGMGIGLFVLFLQFGQSIRYKKIGFTKKNFIVVLTTSLLWTYLLAQASMLSDNHMDFVIKAFLSNVILVVACSMVLSNERSNYLFFRGFILSLVITSVMYCITYLLSCFINIEKLYMFSLHIIGGNYEGSGRVYFPGTVLYSYFTVGSLQLPRLQGLFREAGILQAFIIWAFFNLKTYNLNNKWVKLFLILGLVGTFSTAGIGVFLGTVCFYLILNKKPIRGIMFLAFMCIALFYTPYIGLADKSETHGASISDRQIATTVGIEKLYENPIGEGIYSVNPSDLTNSGINLLAGSYKYGIFGVLLILVAYFAPMYKYRAKKNYLISIFPIFVTMLLSQPIVDAPLVYILFLAMYANKEKQKQETVKAKRRWKKIKIVA